MLSLILFFLLALTQFIPAHSSQCAVLDYTNPQRFRFPGDLGVHLDQLLEWWWMMGTVRTTEDQVFGVGVFLTRVHANPPVCGPEGSNNTAWSLQFTVTDPQATGSAQHIYAHLPWTPPLYGFCPDAFFSATNNSPRPRTNRNRAKTPAFKIRGAMPSAVPGQKPQEFYRYEQCEWDESSFEFSVTAVGSDTENPTLSPLALRNLKLLDLHGPQPMGSAGMISAVTLGNNALTSIEVDQTRLKLVNERHERAELVIGSKVHKIETGVFYNSHQWVTYSPAVALEVDSGINWLWFWIALDDDARTTITIGRLPPYAHHMAANVVSVSRGYDEDDSDSPFDELDEGAIDNRVYSGHHDVLFDASDPWTSPRNGNTYYTKHHIRIIPEGYDLHLESLVQDSEFGYKQFNGLGPQIYYYEGAARVWGFKNGRRVSGVGNIETYGKFYTNNAAKYPPV